MTTRCCLRTVARDGWEDAYVTSVARRPITDEAGLDDFFAELAALVEGNRIVCLQAKIHGVCARKESIERARFQALERRALDVEVPLTFVEGAPCIGGLLAGVQIIGVIPKTADVRVETIRHQGAALGRELSLPGHRVVFLAGVSGFDSQRRLSVTEQADGMLRNAKSILEARGVSPKHIVRTWIYMARILDWYGEFNRIRTSRFRDFGLIGNNGRDVLPASTGIQGKRIAGEECFMDVLAIVSDDAHQLCTAPMRNTRQNEAYEYGSSFSRGMVVTLDESPTLYLSGTASIDTHGKTVHHGDEQGQVVETLLVMAALLDGQNARLRDICQATAYCKRDADYRAFQRIVDHLDMKDIPFVPVLADVCRDELLFEIDSVAVTQHAHDGGQER